jgi:DNA-directed RNA polymerase subunit F|tara:strand:- start:117 stop:353 length:237 start_codon:yes stop_codon:yes gene_type:complete
MIYRAVEHMNMLAFLLPLASKIITDAINKIPENEELGEKMVEICLVILAKAVKLTKTDMDDQLLEVVTKAIKSRDEEG